MKNIDTEILELTKLGWTNESSIRVNLPDREIPMNLISESLERLESTGQIKSRIVPN